MKKVIKKSKVGWVPKEETVRQTFDVGEFMFTLGEAIDDALCDDVYGDRFLAARETESGKTKKRKIEIETTITITDVK